MLYTHDGIEMFDLAQNVMDFEVVGTYRPQLKVGDWISRSISAFLPINTLKLAQHHGVICGFDPNTGEPLVSQLNVSYLPHFCIGIKTTLLTDYLNGDRVFRLYTGISGRSLTEDQLRTRIKDLVDSKKYYDTYSLTKRNCEHYATELITGTATSYQIQLLRLIREKCIQSTPQDKMTFVRSVLQQEKYPTFVRCKW